MASFLSYFSAFAPSSWVSSSGITGPGEVARASATSTNGRARKFLNRSVAATLLVASAAAAGGVSAQDYGVAVATSAPPTLAFETTIVSFSSSSVDSVQAGYWQDLLTQIDALDSVSGIYVPELLQ